MPRDAAGSDGETDRGDKPDSVIEKEIMAHVRDLHKRGHTRKDIVHNLREVADTYEDFWEGKDGYVKSPSEKNFTLPGDDPDDE